VNIVVLTIHCSDTMWHIHCSDIHSSDIQRSVARKYYRTSKFPLVDLYWFVSLYTISTHVDMCVVPVLLHWRNGLRKSWRNLMALRSRCAAHG
jgi:hypothetical protein